MDCGYSLEPPRRVFVAENFKFMEEKFSIYLNRRVFVMSRRIDTHSRVNNSNRVQMCLLS